VWLCPVPARTPGLIWVRDRSVGDGMVDGSIRKGIVPAARSSLGRRLWAGAVRHAGR
jgi:hypothetical protein